MALEIDFGNGNNNTNSGNAVNDETQTSLNGTPDTTSLNEPITPSIEENDNGQGSNQPTEQSTKGVQFGAPLNNADNNSKDKEDDNKQKENVTDETTTNELEKGTRIEVGDDVYVVDEKGNLLDKDGKVFKEAKDVSAWMTTFNQDDKATDSENDETVSTIETIQNAIGIEVVDENGNAIQYNDDAEGINNYVKDVISQQTAQAGQGAINKFFNDNPIVADFCNYIAVNGNANGYGSIPDYSNITIDEKDATQQESIIKYAAREFNNPSINDNYIKYLKETGGLYNEAVNQLNNLVEKNKAYHAQLAQEAKARQDEEVQRINAYWNNVSNVIQSGIIGDIKLPESFTKEVDGRSMTYGRNDFYDYLSRAAVQDENGNTMSQYQADLAKVNPEEALNKELLDAWLMFTGSSYKDLVNMAMKEDQVRTIKLKAKEQSGHKTIKLSSPKSSGKIEDIIL